MPSISDVLRKHAEHGDDGLRSAVEELVRHGHVAEYLVGLTRHRNLPEGPIVGYRHPNGFSKIRLARLPEDDWTVRLHLWDPGGADSDIHDHRWSFASYVASGSIVECRYEVVGGAGQSVMYDCSPSRNGSYLMTNQRVCDARQAAENAHQRGDSYQRDASIMHRVRAGSDTPALTIFVQGPSIKNSTTVVKQCTTGTETVAGSWFTPSEVRDELCVALGLLADA